MALDRFSTALYTVSEAASYLDVPKSTLNSWAHGYRNQPPGRRAVVGAPILTTLPRQAARQPVIPFIGLAEGAVLTAIRRSGVPLQRIRPALEQLDGQFGLSHALASRRLYSDGAEVLFDYAEAADDPGRLIRLPAYEVAEIVVDPARGFGQPIFVHGGARLEDALGLFRAGEPLDVVADEYGIPRDHLEDAVRIATRAAA